MTKTKRYLSLFMLLVTLFGAFSILCMDVSAATKTGKKACIEYIYFGKKEGMTTYRNETYTIKKNEKVTIEGFWNTEKLKNQTSVGIGGKKLKNYLRFDVHIIDQKTGKVVNQWYGLSAGSKFKVFSAVPGYDSKYYTVKVTSYWSTYKTYKDSDMAGVATYLKYRLSY